MKKSFDWGGVIPERMVKGKAYTPGEQRNTTEWIKINTNEFPFDPSESVLKAIQDESAKLRFYPEPTGKALRETIAAKYGTEADQVVLFNGCDDALNCCLRAFVDPGERVGYLNPSYSLYTTLLSNHGAIGVPVEYDASFQLPVVSMLGANVKMFMLTTPNAPSGVSIKEEAFMQLLEQKDSIFVMDETYGDFSDWSAIPLIQQHPNVIVVKSFSKTFGLAGLRLGFGVAAPEAVAILHKIRDVYNVDRISQVAGKAALEDTDYYQGKIDLIQETKNKLVSFFEKQLGWTTYPSSTNFVFVFPKDANGNSNQDVAQGLYSFLVENRTLVRYFTNHPLIDSGLRVSIGTPEQMRIFQDLIEQWVATAK